METQHTEQITAPPLTSGAIQEVRAAILGDIPQQPPGVDPEDLVPAALNEAAEAEKQKNTNALLQQTEMAKNMGGIGGVLALLFMMFMGKGKEGKNLMESGAMGKFMTAFGMDKGTVQSAMDGVSAGDRTAPDAAQDLLGGINQENIDWSAARNIKVADLITNNSPTMLHPDLVAKMRRDPEVAQMVKWTFEAAERENLDGNLLANQFFAESDYETKDKHGNPITSNKGARGIAQFMPMHKGKWGLKTDADFYNPKKSIDAGAQFMRHLTDKTGSQELALIPYNGRMRAIGYAEESTGVNNITLGGWMDFMQQERLEKGISEETKHLWRHETFDYVKKIVPNYWSKDLLARAEQQQSPLQQQFGIGGVAEETRGQPDPLTTAFGEAKGVDQIALAAQQQEISITTTRPAYNALSHKAAIS